MSEYVLGKSISGGKIHVMTVHKHALCDCTVRVKVVDGELDCGRCLRYLERGTLPWEPAIVRDH